MATAFPSTRRRRWHGSAKLPIRDTRHRKIGSVSCIRTVTASPKTISWPWRGSARLLTRDTSSHNTVSAECTRMAGALPKTISKPSLGTAKPPNRDLPTRGTASVLHTRMVEAFRRTILKLSRGFAKLPIRVSKRQKQNLTTLNHCKMQIISAKALFELAQMNDVGTNFRVAIIGVDNQAGLGFLVGIELLG